MRINAAEVALINADGEIVFTPNLIFVNLKIVGSTFLLQCPSFMVAETIIYQYDPASTLDTKTIVFLVKIIILSFIFILCIHTVIIQLIIFNYQSVMALTGFQFIVFNWLRTMLYVKNLRHGRGNRPGKSG